MTVTEKLLVAAYLVENRGRSPFTAEELVVSAWEKYPDTFGLKGINDESGTPCFPDSNRVFAEIMGSKPIRQKGYLIKTGIKQYELTGSGRNAAKMLLGVSQDDENTRGKASIARDVLVRIERLLASRAVARHQQGETERITFHDACIFWGISPASKAIELTGALADVDSSIDTLEDAVSCGSRELKTGKLSANLQTVDLLRNVQETLKKKFASELVTISKRTDQR